MSKRRVVITGLGVISPVGNSVEDAWASILAGKSGIGPITHFDVSGFPVRFGGEVRDFDITDYIGDHDNVLVVRVENDYICLGNDDPPRFAVISIGNFDGVHIGHLSLFQRVKELGLPVEC